MATTRIQALEIALETKKELMGIYGDRLRGVYLYGSAARNQLTPDSDIDIAVVLDDIKRHFDELERTRELGSKISLQYNTIVMFLFVPEKDYKQGTYAVYRAIKRDGLAV